MNKKILKIGGSAVSVLLAGILAVQLVTTNDLVANASVSTLPGIETIRNKIIDSNESFRVLEVTPNIEESDFGYLIGGREPFYVCLSNESADAKKVIPSQYLKFGSQLTYEECSMYDEDSHTWLSLEEKLNTFQMEKDKISFALFMQDQYQNTLATKKDLEKLVHLESDLVRGNLSFQSNKKGNYQIEMELVPSSVQSIDQTGQNYYYYDEATEVDLDTLRAEKTAGNQKLDELYYKKLYYGGLTFYALVGDANAVLKDADRTTGIYKMVLSADVVGSDSPYKGTMILKPRVDGLYPESIEFVENTVTYQVEVWCKDGTNAVSYTWDSSKGTVYASSMLSPVVESGKSPITLTLSNDVVKQNGKNIPVPRLEINASNNKNYIKQIDITIFAQVKDAANKVKSANGTEKEYMEELKNAYSYVQYELMNDGANLINDLLVAMEEKLTEVEEKLNLYESYQSALSLEEKGDLAKSISEAQEICLQLMQYSLDGILDDGSMEIMKEFDVRLQAALERYFAIVYAELPEEVLSVINMIKALPVVDEKSPTSVLTNAKSKILEVQTAYERLSEANRKLVSNYGVFQTYCAKVSAYLEKKVMSSVQQVIALIQQIGNVENTPECYARIQAARMAYDALTAEQKLEVGSENLAVLETAEKAYEELNQKDSGKTGETKESGETKETKESMETGETKESGETGETRESEEIVETKETKETEETKETKESSAQETGESAVAESTEETSPTQPETPTESTEVVQGDGPSEQAETTEETSELVGQQLNANHTVVDRIFGSPLPVIAANGSSIYKYYTLTMKEVSRKNMAPGAVGVSESGADENGESATSESKPLESGVTPIEETGAHGQESSEVTKESGVMESGVIESTAAESTVAENSSLQSKRESMLFQNPLKATIVYAAEETGVMESTEETRAQVMESTEETRAQVMESIEETKTQESVSQDTAASRESNAETEDRNPGEEAEIPFPEIQLTQTEIEQIIADAASGTYNNKTQEIAELFLADSNFTEYAQGIIVDGAFYTAGKGQWVKDTGNFQFNKDSSGNDYVLAEDGKYHVRSVNTEAFRSNVFDLTEEDYASFGVSVTSMTPSQIGELSASEIAKFNLVYIGYGKGGYTAGTGSDLDDLDSMGIFFSTLIAQEIPTIIDGQLVFGVDSNGKITVLKDTAATNTNMYKLAVLLMQETPASYLNEDGSVVQDVKLGNINYADLSTKILSNGKDKNGNGCFVNQTILCYTQYHYMNKGINEKSLVNHFFTENGLCTSSTANTGFEAVLKEIETENLYRQADKGAGYPQLDNGVSVGRAIRYIINYIYKRNEVVKSSLRVLEIQPGNASTGSNDELTKQKVSEWVGKQISTDQITIDTMTSTEFVGHIDDINSKYDLVYIGSDISSFSTVTSEDTHSAVVSGASTDGGTSYGYVFNWKKDAWEYVPIGKTLSTDYTCELGNDPWNYESIRYFHVNYYHYILVGSREDVRLSAVHKKGVSSANNEGYIFGMNSGIKAVVVGWNATLTENLLGNGYIFHHSKKVEKTVYNDSSMNGLIYTNIGDVKGVKADVTGVLKSEWTGGDFNSGAKKEAWYRYPGNDLTAEKYNKLMDFVDASYPVVVSDQLYRVDASGNRTVDDSTVDNSSYLYDFLNATLGFSNVVSASEIEGGASSLFAFYINKPKMTLNITNYHDNVSGASSTNTGGMVHVIQAQKPSNKFYLNYTFDITNDGSVSNDTLYTAKLYLDSNADGKFSELYEELEGVTITQADTNTQIPYNQLRAGVSYIMSRELPSNYEGVVTWSIEVHQNSNKMIRASEQGYTKLYKGEDAKPANIRILQIMKSSGGGKLNLQASVGTAKDSIDSVAASTSNTYKIYHTLVYGDQGKTIKDNSGRVIDVDDTGISKDYNLDIRTINNQQYMQEYNNSMNADGTNDYLDNYDMLILGFSDMYDDIEGAPLNGILEYIESGKSILFAHDTTGFYEQAGSNWTDDMTKAIRSYVGMDTYGVTVSRFGNAGNADEYKVLNSGRAITQNDSIWNTLYPRKDDSGRYVYNKKQIGFKPNSGRTEAVAEIQGRSYGCMTRYANNGMAANVNGVNYISKYFYRKNISKVGSNVTTTVVNNVNKGQITAYPYYLPDELVVPGTHAQYFSLDMNADDDDDGETDVVVWYCLNRGNDDNGVYYNASYNDTMNNYYIYNKGNVTYTGVGHSGDATSIEEAKLFINTMVAAYNAGKKDITIDILDEELKKTEVLYEYDDAENELSFSDDLQKINFTFNDPNIVSGTKNLEARFYIYKTGSVGTPATIVSKNTTYSLADATVEVMVEGTSSQVLSRQYLQLDVNETINATQKGEYFLLAKDQSNATSYISIEEVFDPSSEAYQKFRCSSDGGSYGANQGYVKCFNWSKNAWEIMALVDGGNPGIANVWLSAANRLHLYTYGNVEKSELKVVEFTDMKVYDKNGAVVDRNKLQSGQNYYVEVPIETLKPAGIITKADTRNMFLIGGTPVYTTVNKYSKAEKVRKGTTVFTKVDFTTIGIFDLD